MVAPSSTFSSKAPRPLRPYAWALVIVVTVDVACRFLAPRGSLELVFREIRGRVEQQAAPVVQVVGDSVAAGAVMDDIVSTPDLRVRNDSVMGSSPTFTYFLVREQLKSGHRPKALIFAHHPRLFATSAPTSLIGLFAYWSELPHMLASKHGFGRKSIEFSLLTRVSYLLAYRTQLRELITGETPTFVVAGAGVPQRQRLSEYAAAIAVNRLASTPLEQNVPDVYRVPFEPTVDNDTFFRKLVDLAADNDIKMYWLSIPVPQRIAEERRKLNYDQRLEEYLRPFVTDGRLRYLLKSSPVYRDDEFDDFAHLNMRGTVHFSCEVRSILAEKNLAEDLLGDSTSRARRSTHVAGMMNYADLCETNSHISMEPS